ncbi:MAG: DUF1343 domain-containing protein [Thermoanaerobaculales bacterium]|nr:DUF1343 domain-containing protein [Thermoanaerobaculales bacterium]
MAVQTGLQRLLADSATIKDRRWALLANQASVTRNLETARLALAAVAGPPIRLFAPEHGLEGVAQDMEAVADSVDPLTGATVHSLYGEDAGTLAPKAQSLENLDAIVVDMPDIGSRYYTFAASLDGMMAACEMAGVEVVVLDRPNPLGGLRREGGMVQPGFESFVSQLPTPIRHGLTLGEIALLLHRERYPDLELTVVPCLGWKRSDLFDATDLPWVSPSPNMPTLDTALLYPGLCLIEATTLSEGRGTTRPFHLVGAPWVDAHHLVDSLRTLELPGVAFRATSFRPEFQKHANRICAGCDLHITNREMLRPLELGLEIVKTIHDLYPNDFSWRAEPYEFVTEAPALDLLTGSSRARSIIEGGQELQCLFDEWHEEVKAFENTLGNILLYHE